MIEKQNSNTTNSIKLTFAFPALIKLRFVGGGGISIEMFVIMSEISTPFCLGLGRHDSSFNLSFYAIKFYLLLVLNSLRY